METRITVLKMALVSMIFMIMTTTLKSQSAIHADTLWAQDSILFLPEAPLHPSLFKIQQSNGELLKNRIDFSFTSDTTILLHSNRDFEQPFILIYQDLSPRLTQPLTWIDTQLVKSDYLIKSIPTGLESEASFPTWSNISYSGHFGRGLTIGNAQNATMQSNFDLQLRGTLPHGIEVTGALSDNSIPIQPEGNSLRLQEFDKVFIRLRKNQTTMVAGDHEIHNPDNYFIRYYKKTKGIYGETESTLASGWNQNSSVNYSVSKGKYKRSHLEAEEGNQGPYRISQSENNLFLVVLAGTEKVYLDGVLMQRGELNDYTIDYNLGEITFTPRVYISATSRIIIEYEYAEQNYLRSLFAGHTTWEKNNWELGLTVYSEQDGKSSFQNQLLTPENESILAEAGSDVENIYGSSVIPWKDGFEEGVVLYQKIDTMGHKDVLQLVKKPVQSELYTASFQYVGEGNGDYLPAGEFTNGEVFYWVAPDHEGNPTGSYAPVTSLEAPETQQMIGFRVGKQWSTNQNIYSEWSLSHDNNNRFSSTSESRQTGWAHRSGFSWKKDLDSVKNKFIHVEGNWEQKNIDFNPVSSYRSIEFERDWNYDGTSALHSENIYQLTTQYHSAKWEGFYTFKNLNVKNDYKGIQNEVKLSWNPGKWNVKLYENLLQSKTNSEKTIFSRPALEIQHIAGQNKRWKWKAGYEGEFNQIRNIKTDSLTARSLRYDKIYAQVKWHEAGSLMISKRHDYSLSDNRFEEGFHSHDIQFTSRIENDQNSLEWISTLRHISMKNDEVPLDQSQKGWNLLGQLLFSNRWFSEGWTNRGEIRLANGKEPQRQFQYIRVETGKGQYKHVDLNGDSIQQLNEFFPAIYPDERKYIRVSTLENTLISTFNYNFKWSWHLRMKEWTEHHFWSKWSSENSVRIDKRQLRKGKLHLWQIPDSALITSKENLLTNLYYNQNGQKIQQHFGLWIQNQKDFLQSGFEKHRSKETFSKTTLLYTSSLHSVWEIKQKIHNQSAENFHDNNFRIRFWGMSHKIRWLIKSSIQTEYQTSYTKGKETSGDAISSFWSHRFNAQYRPDLNWSFQGLLDWVKVRYDRSEPNLTLEQVMLEGLLPGQNFIWEFSAQRRLPNDLVISLQYSGRKTGPRNIVHQGSIQANLLF